MAYELQDFNNDVVIQSKTTPVVIDFWAEWCGPCKILSPILEKLAAGAQGSWKLVKIDTEQHRQLAAQFGIRSIPSVKMVFQGAIIAEFQGALPEPAVRKWLQENLPGMEDDAGDEISLLEELLREGNRQKAQDLAIKNAGTAGSDPDWKARAAMLSLPDNLDEAETMLNSLKDEPKFEIERETLQALKHLRDIHNGSRQIPDGTPAAESYMNGIRALFEGDFEKAIESFLDTLMRDRKLDEDGARKALIAIFTMLTDHHPLSGKYRRRFSMALY
jgi:putative thioredoxin